MIQYTVEADDDEPFAKLCRPYFEGQTIDVLEHDGDVKGELQRQRYVATVTSCGDLVWERVPVGYYNPITEKLKARKKTP